MRGRVVGDTEENGEFKERRNLWGNVDIDYGCNELNVCVLPKFIHHGGSTPVTSSRGWSLSDGCINPLGLLSEYYTLGGLMGSPRPRCWQIQCLMRSLFIQNCCLQLHLAEGVREFSGAFFIRVIIPFIKAPHSWFNHLPKAPPPSTITLGIRFQHMNLGGCNIWLCESQQTMKNS